MLYILEGCDGSGKSTLARHLKKWLDAEVVHCTTTTPNDYEFFFNIAKRAIVKNIIADRFCYGQFVYQEEKDRPMATTEHDSFYALNLLESSILLGNTKVIYVTAPIEVIKKRLNLRKESILNGYSVEEIQNRYEAIRKRSLLTWNDYYTGGEK